MLANESMGAGARWTRTLERTLESAESEFRPVGKMGLDRESMLVVSSVLVRERERGHKENAVVSCTCSLQSDAWLLSSMQVDIPAATPLRFLVVICAKHNAAHHKHLPLLLLFDAGEYCNNSIIR